MSAAWQSFVHAPPVLVGASVVSAMLVVTIASLRSHARAVSREVGRSTPDQLPPSDRPRGQPVRTDGGESSSSPNTTGESTPTVIDLTALPRPDTDGANDADVAAAIAAVEPQPADDTIDVADVEREADDADVAAAVASVEADLR